MSKKLEEYVVTIPDFPEPGIMFRDITSVIQDPDGLKLAVDGLANLLKDTEFDLIATGGSAEAAVKLVEKLGGQVVKMIFVMELAGLKGREKLKDYDVESLIVYEGK